MKKITAPTDWAEDKFMCHCKSELADFNKAEIGATCLLDRTLQIQKNHGNLGKMESHRQGKASFEAVGSLRSAGEG